MPRSRRRLAFALLTPGLIAVPLVGIVAWGVAERQGAALARDAVGSVALAQARALAARLPADLSPDALQPACVAVAPRPLRLTVIAADGSVLCDTAAQPGRMVRHDRRPEVLLARARGEAIALRESRTLHRPLLYAAVRQGDDPGARVVRLAVPAEVAAGAARHAPWTLLVLGSTVAMTALSLLLMSRTGRRIDRMRAGVEAVARDVASQPPGLPAVKEDDLGALEEALNRLMQRIGRLTGGTRAERTRVEGILRAMVEGVVVIDADGRIAMMNRRAEELFGLAEDTAYEGRHLIEVCRDPDLQSALREAVTTQTKQTRREITLPGEIPRHLALSIAALGADQGWVLVFHDVSDLKRLEVIRRDFIANVSHELRTPLAAVGGYAETLLGGALADRERAVRFVEIIDRHTKRLARLIDDLSALSDLELGRFPIRKQQIALGPLVDEALDLVREQAATAGIMIAREVPSGLPSIVGDPDRIHQVLVNLIDNALKHTPRGGMVGVRARTVDENGRSMVQLEVADTGTGIPGEHVPRLTERFYRVDPARGRERGGTGLGLAIVKHIVEAHAGRLEIASEVNVGTTVRCTIPVAPA